MTRSLLLLCLLSIGASGCAARNRFGAPCQWPSEAAASLDLRDQTQLRHLRDDAWTAEDLAVSYADSARTPQRPGEHRRATELCEAALFGAIAHVHGVTPQQVTEALARQIDTPR